jgi:hypothetical protein
VPEQCQSDADCNDGQVCNGQERCDPSSSEADPETGCVPGEPVVCDDGASCTEERCSEEAGGCVVETREGACDDGVSCTTDRCAPEQSERSSGCVHEADDSLCNGFCFQGGECDPDRGCVGGRERDCRDFNPCTADRCVESERMCVHEPRDDDGDGFATAGAFGQSCGGEDCDDSNASVNPDAEELCNGRDDDCDNEVDEGCTSVPDTCDTAQPIELDDGEASITGTLGGLNHDYQTLCSSSASSDALYYIDVEQNSDITIDTVGSEIDTVLAAGTECGQFLGCDNDIVPDEQTASRIWVHQFGSVAAAGSSRLYIMVESDAQGASGSYTLNVEVSSNPANDTCSEPTLDITEGGSVLGFIPENDPISSERGSCQAGFDASPEGLVELTAGQASPSPGDDDGSTVSAEFQVLSTEFDPVAHMRRESCGQRGAEVRCEDSDSFGNGIHAATFTAELEVGLPYYLFADGGSVGDGYLIVYNP